MNYSSEEIIKYCKILGSVVFAFAYIHLLDFWGPLWSVLQGICWICLFGYLIKRLKEPSEEDQTSYKAATVTSAFALVLYLDLIWIWWLMIQGIVWFILYDWFIYKREDPRNENKKLYAVLTVIAIFAIIHLYGFTWTWLPIFEKLLNFGFILVVLYVIIKIAAFPWRLWKEELLCWIINKYFGKYFEKDLNAGKNLTVELANNYETLLLSNVSLNYNTLKDMAGQKKLSFGFSSVSFDRLLITTDYRSLRMELNNLLISMQPLSQMPIGRSSKVLAEEFEGLLVQILRASMYMICPVLPIMESLTVEVSPRVIGVILFSIAYNLAAALLSEAGIISTVIVAAIPSVAVVLCSPKIQTAISAAILNKYIWKYLPKQYMSLDQIETSIWKGSLALMDVVLDCNVLNELVNDRMVTMTTFQVRAESVSLEIPWRNFAMNNSTLNLTEVSLTVQPKYESVINMEEYRPRMLKACHGYVNHVQHLHPASVVADIKLQLENIVKNGYVFYEPKVDFKMNGANIQLVAKVGPKLKKEPEEPGLFASLEAFYGAMLLGNNIGCFAKSISMPQY